MKKLMLMAVGFALLSGVSQAACVLGTFCNDGQGNTSAGGVYLNSTNGFGGAVASSTTISTIVPSSVGQLIMCNTCTGNAQNNGGIVLCASTAAVAGSFVIVNSTGPVCK